MSLRWLVLTIPLTGPLVAGGAISPAAPGATPASPSGTFAEMLRTIPDDVLSADGSMITFTDTELMWERVEVGDDPTERATFEPLRSLPVVILPDVMNRDGLTDGDALRDEIGFDGYDIQRGSLPARHRVNTRSSTSRCQVNQWRTRSTPIPSGRQTSKNLLPTLVAFSNGPTTLARSTRPAGARSAHSAKGARWR